MKQIIAKNQDSAVKFAAGGKRSSQRAAYWREGKKAFRAERLPGDSVKVQEDVGGCWWSATKTIAQKLGIEK